MVIRPPWPTHWSGCLATTLWHEDWATPRGTRLVASSPGTRWRSWWKTSIARPLRIRVIEGLCEWREAPPGAAALDGRSPRYLSESRHSEKDRGLLPSC